MEAKKLSELIPLSLQNLQRINLESTGEISIYFGDLTDKCIVDSIITIKKSFPQLPLSFYDIFIDRIRANGFTDTRLQDAIDHVIDNCTYPQPTIAQFISFDKKVRTYTYSEYCDLCERGDGMNYLPVRIKGNIKPVWVHINNMDSIKHLLVI